MLFLRSIWVFIFVKVLCSFSHIFPSSPFHAVRINKPTKNQREVSFRQAGVQKSCNTISVDTIIILCALFLLWKNETVKKSQGVAKFVSSFFILLRFRCFLFALIFSMAAECVISSCVSESARGVLSRAVEPISCVVLFITLLPKKKKNNKKE